ncbi:MAG: hypothetical protein JWO88_665 [Frankiales bacterium]|nr:hypothetical protein [Frankiales bacterium]
MIRRVLTRAWTGWSRWAFDPIDTASMAALRIAVGLLTVAWTLSMLPDANTFLSRSGVQRGLPHYDSGAWSVQLGPPYIVLAVLLLAGVGLALGWRTRIVSVVVAVLLLAVQRRDPWVLNSGDLLLRELAFFVMLMPAGETWSLDAHRRARRGLTERRRAPWALRLVQLQVSALYLFSVWAKVRGVDWNDGTAVGIALQLEDLQRFTLPAALSSSLLVSAVLTYSSLAVEASLAFGLWLPRLRYWVMAAGVGLHLGIEASLLIGFFSLAVISSYLAFVPPEHLRALVARLQGLRARGAAPGSARDPVPLRSS